jgi:tetratricopeptide (TPR) repeat protein
LDAFREAVALFRQLGEPGGEAEALNGLGEALRGTGRLEQSRACHTDALALAVQIGEAYEQACAHRGIAATYHATGEPDRARQHWQRALDLFTDLGVPEAEPVRADLAALANSATNQTAGG